MGFTNKTAPGVSEGMLSADHEAYGNGFMGCMFNNF